MSTLDGEVDMASSYADRLKALHADINLMNHVKFFIYDIFKFGTGVGDAGVRLRIQQDPSAHFCMNSVYFTPKQLHILTSFQGRDGCTLREVLIQATRDRMSGHARTYSTSGYQVRNFDKDSRYILWNIKDLAPEMEDLFGVKKHFEVEHGFKLLFDKFVKKRLD